MARVPDPGNAARTEHQPVVAHEVPVIAHEDDDRVFSKVECLQPRHYASDRIVDHGDHAVAEGDSLARFARVDDERRGALPVLATRKMARAHVVEHRRGRAFAGGKA